MTPRRIDRQTVHARLSPIAPWIIETLLDAFEPAALAAVAVVEKRRGKDKPRPKRGRNDEDTDDD